MDRWLERGIDLLLLEGLNARAGCKVQFRISIG
jgi:hypothetical protein